MNKSAIGKFAAEAREDLHHQVKKRLEEYQIQSGIPADPSLTHLSEMDRALTNEEMMQRKAIIDEIRRYGFDHVVEETAYTWFNRMIALRFMEVNGYMPNYIRVFTDAEGRFKPEMLDKAADLHFQGLDLEKLSKLEDQNNTDDLFRYLLLLQCNEMSKILPGLFQPMGNWMELLLPKNLLSEESVIGKMIFMIPEEDWMDQSVDPFDPDEENAVLILGWLYQFYISKEHQRIIKSKKPVVKKDIPAATALYTTDWIVQYMVSNTLGRFWIERNPESSLKQRLKFNVLANQEIHKVADEISPEQLTFLDPAMGSGHILVFAFDVLKAIYNEMGYSDRSAVKLILENNLFGLDIDDRAAQIAYFALMMKARKYDRRIFSRGVQLNVVSIQESNGLKDWILDGVMNDSEQNKIADYLVQTFHHAKELGSLIKVEDYDYSGFIQYLDQCSLSIGETIEEQIWQSDVYPLLCQLAKQAQILSKKYLFSVQNPPYLSRLSGNLKQLSETEYKDFKADLFAMFIRRSLDFVDGKYGYLGFMCPKVWMYGKSYLDIRKYILNNRNIIAIVEMHEHSYDEATVGIESFVLGPKTSDSIVTGIRLSNVIGNMDISKKACLEAIWNPDHPNFVTTDSRKYSLIPESPIAYWVFDAIFDSYKNDRLLGYYAEPKQGLATGNNDRFMRLWFEPSMEKISFNCDRSKKWYPCSKGGEFRKWYGNNEWIVNWENDGYEIKNFRNEKGKLKSRPQNQNMYFKSGLTWSTTSSSLSSFRYQPDGFIFETKGSVCFSRDKSIERYLCGFLNSKITDEILAALSPTVDFHEGPVSKISFKYHPSDRIDQIVQENINLARADWNDYEISWDFDLHPIVKAYFSLDESAESSVTLQDAFKHWEVHKQSQFDGLKANEEEINQYFIDLYGMNDELTPDVEDKHVSIRMANLEDDMKSLLSYAIGCIFGRYSLDQSGVAYAGGEWNPDAYKQFTPDDDNILPITNLTMNHHVLNNHALNRLKEWFRVVFGTEHEKENQQFIAEALGGTDFDETVQQYLEKEFFKDHCGIYSFSGRYKRPIYWLFDSGKKHAFQALIYLHRYTPDLLAQMRTKYIHPIQRYYRSHLEELQKEVITSSGTKVTRLNMEIADLQAKVDELAVYEKDIEELAAKRIELDLDDGVIANRAKFFIPDPKNKEFGFRFPMTLINDNEYETWQKNHS